jgi:hypothetical protein
LGLGLGGWGARGLSTFRKPPDFLVSPAGTNLTAQEQSFQGP